MADASTTSRPRPRPRPKPVARTASASVNALDVESSSSGVPPISTSSAGTPIMEVNDTDEMFIINRHRTSKTWNELEEANKEATRGSSVNLSESDSGEEFSPRSRQKRKRNAPNHRPAWETDSSYVRMLSQEISDNSSSDPEILDPDDVSVTPKGKHKGKRRRSKSRSITPPPVLNEFQKQQTKELVRNAIGGGIRRRSPSPTFDWNIPNDDFELLPELQAIKERIANQPVEPRPIHSSSEDHIVITVHWHPHPRDPTGAKREWQYKIDRNDDFRELFDAVAEDANATVERLRLFYDGRRFFPSVTSRTLHMLGSEIEVAACDMATETYIKSNSGSIGDAYSFLGSQALQTPDNDDEDGNVMNITSDSDDEREGATSPPTQAHYSDAGSDGEGKGATLKLVLRSARTQGKDITLTVRPTTKCGAIVKAFLKKAGFADEYPDASKTAPATAPKSKKGRKSAVAQPAQPTKDPRVSVDGERMSNDAEIGDADLEDGDVVDIVGL